MRMARMSKMAANGKNLTTRMRFAAKGTYVGQ
jgi:hypothetical protein